MVRAGTMDKQEIAEIILKLQWYATFIFCVWFGVAANDRYQKLRDQEKAKEDGVEYKKERTDIMSKLYVSFFICALLHGYYDYKKYSPQYEWAFLLLASFLHYHAATFLVNKVWPLIKSAIAGGKK